MAAPDRPPTHFETRVFEAVQLVPEGKVTTYRDLAAYLNCGSAQAIGQALKRNPFAPIVPCHRVVKTDLTIGGFHGKTEGPYICEKRELLIAEGIEFSESGKIESSHHYRFD